MLRLEQAGFRFDPTLSHWIVHPIDISFGAGQFWGLIGPNGSGKSTLLRLLSGEWAPTTGVVKLSGQPLASYAPEVLASKRAVLSQKGTLQFPFSVEEVVSFGLFHKRSGRGLGQAANDVPSFALAPQAAMQATQVDAYAERLYPRLSGGEACRVDLARVLAQQTPILLLDEPTNHLDPRFQVAILEMCRSLAASGALVIAALHDLNLAARFCDQLLMLKEGAKVAAGPPKDILHAEQLSKVYDITFDVFYDDQERPCVVPASTSHTNKRCTQ